MLIYIPVYILFIFGNIRILDILGLSRRIAIFAAFALFGLGAGLVSSVFMPGSELWYGFNFLSSPLADQIHREALQRFGDTNSHFFASTVPWVLRQPQIGFFMAAIVWSLLGIIAQLLVNFRNGDNGTENRIRTKPISNHLVIVAWAVLVVISSGILYLLSDEHLGPQPLVASTNPTAFYASPPRPPDVPTINTWRTESMTINQPGISVGQMTHVMFIIKHTGDKPGWAAFEAKVNGVIRATYYGFISPGESGPVSFVMAFPFPGKYTIEFGNLSQEIEVVVSDFETAEN